MRIHDIFHTFLLRKVATNSLIEQIQTFSSSIVMKDEEEYEVNDILNNRYHYDKLQYKIAWIDHSSDRAWYSAENFEHFKNILKNYHQRYSEKLDSTLRLIVIIETMLSQWIRNEHKKAKQLIQDVLNRMKAEMKEKNRKRFSKDSFEKNLESALTNTFDRH
jgi:iron-sulfur cluster repair protein YtfE (RIC family)